jgi:hypothetical protein
VQSLVQTRMTKRMTTSPPLADAAIPTQWKGDKAVVIAWGPSLTQEDVDHCHGKARAIAVNDAWELAPQWADALYAHDFRWIDYYHGVPEFRQQKWTPSWPAKMKYPDWKHLFGEHGHGLSLNPYLIHYGHNSGFQALNLAVLFGAKEIFLLGFDMKRGLGGRQHGWERENGEHPQPIRNDSPYDTFVSDFDGVTESLAGTGIKIWNCSLDSALQVFPKARIEEVL